jgi:flavin-dependent dehydrogenase
MKSKVAIVGAGLSGLSAAIFCAREGYKVTVYEQTKEVGQHIPTTVFGTSLIDINKIDKILNLNLKKIMKPVVLEIKFPNLSYRIRHKKYKTYNVEIGCRKTSLNHYLEKIANRCGVEIIKNKKILNPSKLDSDKVIIACGSWPNLWDYLKIDSKQVYAFVGYGKYSKNKDIYLGMVNDDFAPGWICHASSINGIISGMISSKKGVTKKNWNAFSKHLVDHDLVKNFKEVKYLTGKIADRPILTKDEYILVGTIAGYNDPILNHGVIRSLISGKIASISLADPEKGKSLFQNNFSKNFWFSKATNLFDKILDSDLIRERLFSLMPKLWQDILWTLNIIELE